jgi:hypothetical protein
MVVSIEGLIALKRFGGSPMDLLDIQALQMLSDQPPPEFHRRDDA